MSQPKDRHYWTQLRAALTAGQWSSTTPAKAPNGTPLSWSELFRKFNKHCKGFRDVVEIASQTQALALQLAACSTDGDEDGVGHCENFPIELGSESQVVPERLEEASAGYEVLKKLESSNFDTLNFALAYYSYALGNPAECLAYIAKVPDMSDLSNHIPGVGTTRSSTMTLQVRSSTAEPSIISATGSYAASEFSSSIAEIKDGRGWALTEALRSICLKGMSLEKLSPSELQKALDVYNTALPLLTNVESELTAKSSTTPGGNIDFTYFSRYRELWRWVERLIWRAVVAQARTADLKRDDPGSLWSWLEHYSTCSASWPSNFRTAHRSTVSVLYLRALVLRHESVAPSVPTALKTESEKPPQWVHTARVVVQDYRAILSASTKFPKAGERNVKVEDFVDLCVAVWEASGAVGDHGGWVIEVLWWATRMTFNSFRILRHLTRLLYVSGDIPLAKRTLKLYVQIVSKAWQTSEAGAGEHSDDSRRWVESLVAGARALCRYASRLPGIDGIDDVREAGRLVEIARGRIEMGDTKSVATVDLAEGIWHSIMALKEQNPHTRPNRLASAHTLFLQSVEANPTSPGYFQLALSFARPGPLQDFELATTNAGLAVEGDPREIRYWHLLGLLLAATEKWKAAEEILAQGAALADLPGPEEGEDNDEDGQEKLETDGQTLEVPAVTSKAAGRDLTQRDFGGVPPVVDGVNGNGHAPVNGLEVEVRSNGDTRAVDSPSLFAPPIVSKFNANGLVSESLMNGASPEADMEPETIATQSRLFPPDATEIPASARLLKPVLDHPPSSKFDVFEHSLQLRMTQAALTEKIEGAEGAADKWVEIFAWIAERRGSTSEPTPRASMDGARISVDTRPKSVSEHQVLPNTDAASNTRDIEVSNQVPGQLVMTGDFDSLPPPPITISPATPDGNLSAEPNMANDEYLSEKKGRGSGRKRSSSIDRDASKSKKVQQMLKNRVHKEQARITTISRKIGHGVVRGGSLRRSNSTPDFHAVLRQTHYQASSIHSRRRVSSIIHSHDRTPNESPPPPPLPVLPVEPASKRNIRMTRENRLLSDLWLMSAATFRRLGKIEQAKGAIQEAEVRDECNPGVWVQLGLYHTALGQNQQAIDAFQKALFIFPDDIAASVHLARSYISPESTSRPHCGTETSQDNIDLAAGMLSHLTRGPGWDVPEAWYILAKAYGLQDRKDKERECLSLALEMSENRGVRELGTALGWCI